MTLIATIICQQGIIQASDSNLSDASGRFARTGPKVFRLGFADAAISLAGAYGVGTTLMDSWLPACIANYTASAAPSLHGFADHLAVQLQSCSNPEKLRLFHIAGYLKDTGGIHPAFYFVRNAHSINDSTGAYEDVDSTYEVSEDFWGRNYLQIAAGSFAAGISQRYFNGFPAGRVAYIGAMNKLQEFHEQVWSNPDWQFRKPTSLDEVVAFVKLEMEMVSTLFKSSDYPGPAIGGAIQIVPIPAPSGAINL